MFPDLTAAIDGLTVPAEGAALAEVGALRDRLDATFCEALCRFDDTNEWDRLKAVRRWRRGCGSGAG